VVAEVAAVIAALMVGFLAGLLVFKIKQRWCPHCGSLTTAEVPDRERRISRA
jgi:hypothetical protein